MINRFILNEVSYFGPGAREVLPQEISRMGFKKAFVATDKDLIKFGVADKVLKVLEGANIPYEVFSEIKPNPTVSNVKAGVEAFAKSGADFIIAIGGGSSMDTAKAVGIITNNPDFADVVSLEGVADTKKKSVPIIALPTTAGTAAEVTINYVITDEENQKKMVCVDPNDIPIMAIVDAELMYTLPRSLTAATGMDALTHAIEGLITKGAWEMSDMFELKAIEMIARYLETAVNEPQNAEARNGMAVAQYIAGMAFSNVGLGVVHGIVQQSPPRKHPRFPYSVSAVSSDLPAFQNRPLPSGPLQPSYRLLPSAFRYYTAYAQSTRRRSFFTTDNSPFLACQACSFHIHYANPDGNT